MEEDKKEKLRANAELKSEKFVAMVKLLNGVTYDEWNLFKRQIDRMYGMVQLNNTIPTHKEICDFFGEDTRSVLMQRYELKLGVAFQELDRFGHKKLVKGDGDV